MTNTPEDTSSSKYRVAIRRPVTMIMLFLTIIVFGWRSYEKLPINLMPNISYPSLTVRTEYEGAAPEDVEKLVTRPLEEMLSIVSGLVEISSTSAPGRSEITLEFTWGTDMNSSQQEVRDRLDLFEAPKEVTKKPVILRYDPTRDPVIRIAVTASGTQGSPEEEVKKLTTIRYDAEKHLKSDLEAETGIAQVAVKGGQEEEIQVLVDAEKLKGLGLPLQYIVDNLAQQNINLSGGQLREGKTEYLVRTMNEYTNIEQIAATLITTPSGTQKRLSDLADVFMGARERETIVRINGREAVAMDIYKEGDANTVAVCNRVRDLLGMDHSLSVAERFQAQLSAKLAAVERRAKAAMSGKSAQATPPPPIKRTLLDRLPPDVDLRVITDQSRFIEASTREVRDSVIQGGILALAILFIFLQEIKTTLIIGVAIPLSVIATFIPMFLQHISLNVMSLGGLALGVGMLVDDSIVVLESIFRCSEEGDSVVDAAERGTREVAGPVIASTLTTVCVFIPITFVEGIAGQLFRDLALTVSYSLMASLLIAMYLVPLLASRSGLGLRAGQQVVWTMRAWHEARTQQKRSRLGAVLVLPLLGLRYAAEGVRDVFKDAFGPAFVNIAALGRRFGFVALVKALLSFCCLPLLLLMALCQLLLHVLYVLFSTALHLFCVAVLVVALVVRLLFKFTMGWFMYLFDKSFNLFRDSYGVLLAASLRFSAVFLLIVTLLAVHSGYVATKLGRELIPPMKQGEFGMRMEARAGTRLADTERRARVFEAVIRDHPEVDNVTVEIGQEKKTGTTKGGENVAQFTVQLKDPERTAPIQDGIVRELRDKVLRERTDEVINFTLPSMFSFKTAIELMIVGEDLAELKRVGEGAVEVIRKVPGVKDAELSIKTGYPELIIELDRESLAEKKLSPGQVALRLRTEVQGDVATRFSRGGEKVDIRVRTDQALLNSVDDLRKLSVTDGPVPIPLSDVAKITVQEGPSEIRRVDQKQVAVITTNVEGRDLAAVASEIDEAVKTVNKPDDFYFQQGGQNRELGTAYASLRFALILAIFLVYVVMACQFESIVHPALVMFSIPLAFIGVIYTLYYTDTSLSVMVFLGGIILAGIVVKNAIVLVDYINLLREREMPKAEAIVQAGKVRLRPILMTTLTTVLGLLPMLVATGEGSEMRKPMALTVIAGLSLSTLLTLVIIPMVYYMFGGKDKTR